jgi:lysozyme
MKLTAYRDTNNYWTIGVGHLLGTSPRMSTIFEREAMALLDVDIDEAENLARSLVPLFDSLSDPQQRALVNMAFNRGGHLAHSTTILPAILEASAGGDWGRVREAMSASQWAQQVGIRAERLADQFELLA